MQVRRLIPADTFEELNVSDLVLMKPRMLLDWIITLVRLNLYGISLISNRQFYLLIVISIILKIERSNGRSLDNPPLKDKLSSLKIHLSLDKIPGK